MEERIRVKARSFFSKEQQRMASEAKTKCEPNSLLSNIFIKTSQPFMKSTKRKIGEMLDDLAGQESEDESRDLLKDMYNEREVAS